MSLLIYYMEDLFSSPFPNDLMALDILQQNPRIFQLSLDVFQKAFFEMPEASRAIQVFERTQFVKLTPNWEEHERKMFMFTLRGLRRRFQITEEVIQEDLAKAEALNSGVKEISTGTLALEELRTRKWVCPECEVASSTELWNQATAFKFGDDVYSVDVLDEDMALFICPRCKKENCGEVILEETKYNERIEQG